MGEIKIEGQDAKERGVYKKKMVFIKKKGGGGWPDTSIKEKEKRNKKNIERKE